MDVSSCRETSTGKGPAVGKPLPSGLPMDISEREGERIHDDARTSAGAREASAADLIEEFASVAEPEALLRLVVLRAVVETASDRGVLSWIEGDEMIAAHSDDPFGAPVPTGSRWPLGGEKVGRRARLEGRPVSGEFRGERHDVDPALRETHVGLRHLLAVPITVAGEHLAMLCVSRRRSEEYAEGDRSDLALIARAAAQPLHVARLQEQLSAARVELGERAAQAESVERVKTDILRLASHELRTPLTVLNGYLSLIGSGFFGEIPQPLAGVLGILARRTADMNALVNDMLVAARVEDGSSTSVRVPTDLRNVVHQAFAAVRPRAAGHHSLQVAVPDEPVMVSIDEDRVTIAVRNILDNAVKYSPQGGEVKCILSMLGDTARVRVSDHGLGIALEDRDKLFSRFGRILTTANSNIPGIGLGLYFSREVARRHGGDVVLGDNGDTGTVFDLLLPMVAG